MKDGRHGIRGTFLGHPGPLVRLLCVLSLGGQVGIEAATKFADASLQVIEGARLTGHLEVEELTCRINAQGIELLRHITNTPETVELDICGLP